MSQYNITNAELRECRSMLRYMATANVIDTDTNVR